jgi:hypothetical protein
MSDATGIPSAPAAPSPDVTFKDLPDGRTQVETIAGGRLVSRLQIIRCTVRVGAATLRMDGIADVYTDKEQRRHGYARRMLEATIEHMRGGDACLTMLYGIPDFYPRFGYATAGPEYLLHLNELSRPASLPQGWTTREVTAPDIPALRRLYDAGTAQASGAAVRAERGWVWSQLAAQSAAPAASAGEAVASSATGCRLLLDPQGTLRAYVWRGRSFWYAGHVQRQDADALVLAEVMADGPVAADAAVGLCRRWAAEEATIRGRPVSRVTIGLPPGGHVARAAMLQDATFEQRFQVAGGSMARVLDTQRLLAALAPELTARARAAGLREGTMLVCETEEGQAAVQLSGTGVSVVPAPAPEPAHRPGSAAAGVVAARLTQSCLARLALGAFAPEELLDRLEWSLDERARDVIVALFPQRRPHMYWPDRY